MREAVIVDSVRTDTWAKSFFVLVAAVNIFEVRRLLSTYSGPLSGSSRKATSQKKTATVDISFMFSGRILLIELIV